jgi:chromate transporter
MPSETPGPTSPDAPEALARPASCTELFVAFTGLALQGFGGVLAVAQRVLCEQRRWLSRADFTEMISLAQVLPGPNVINLAIMFGDRHFGTRGALAAMAGMLAVPIVIVLSATAIYTQYATQPMVAGALRGMGAAAAGMIIGTAIKLAAPLGTNALGRVGVVMVALASFGAIALLRWPLVAVLPALGLAACALAWWRIRPAKV